LPSLASFAPRPDGTHLTALFAHLRDLEILEPSDRSRPARHGSPYLEPDQRHGLAYLQATRRALDRMSAPKSSPRKEALA